MTERLHPKDRWARTSIGSDAHVTTLLDRSRTRLVNLTHLRANLKHAIDHKQWFVVCCMCSLIGELVFASLDPIRKHDKFPKLADLRPVAAKRARRKQRGQKRHDNYYLLAALRHTCFHPAMTEPMQDLPGDIFFEMSNLHTIEAADWALEQLDNAISFELGF